LTLPEPKKILIIFGTRPEAIKLIPVMKELERRAGEFRPVICVTAQHRHMMDQVLNCFRVQPQYDLNIMKPGQDLFHVTSSALLHLREVIEQERPDWVLVQGDTTTTFAGALASFYLQVPVGHVEAGLRTNNKYSPFPEEINRKLTTQVAHLHFAPTSWARQNLLREGVSRESIRVTGNTAIDALLSVASRKLDFTKAGLDFLDLSRKIIVVTAHRRESFGEPFLRLCKALKEICTRFPEAQLVYPVHLNPNVRKAVFGLLREIENMYLIEPLEYEPFIHLMANSHFILTDSGGIQEEAPSLHKPVLIMRDTTERPEALAAGTAKLVGTDYDRIIEEASRLMLNHGIYQRMSSTLNPFGDGHASSRIADILAGLNAEEFSYSDSAPLIPGSSGISTDPSFTKSEIA
jgi:UDP-N-acetylglucosamine 2-epimerase (non-hydrolysing)